MVSLLKEQENFLRYAILTVDHSNEALQNFIEQHLKNNKQTFEDFLNQNQHEIYHLFYDAKCCQCGPGYRQKSKRILSVSQMGLLFEKQKRLSVHKPTRHSDFCCSYAKPGVTTAVLDVALARCLLINCCIDLFWFSCLNFQGMTFEQFLNANKHTIYHLWNTKDKCCLCQPNFIFPCNGPLIMENELKNMFSRTLTPCEIDLNSPVNGSISVCGVTAKPGITIKDIHLDLQNIILQYCCSTRKSVEKLAELRNLNFGHMKKARMSCADFNKCTREAGTAIVDIAIVFGKSRDFKQMLQDLHDKPLDTRMFCQYEKILLQTITTYESIQEVNYINCQVQVKTYHNCIHGQKFKKVLV